ncbi:MAG: glycosyltransferase [Bacteroidales bacterium]|nr:glycosyltransferase [Bacteroidales bacterium]
MKKKYIAKNATIKNLRMKHILFITAFNPSKNDAGSNYSRQLLFKLAQVSTIDLVIFKKKNQILFSPENPNMNVLSYSSVSKLSRLMGFVSMPIFFPIFTARFSWGMMRSIKNYVLLNNYDIIYFDFSQSFIYSFFIKHPNKILMSHDVIFQRYDRRKHPFLKWIKCSERKMVKSGQTVFTFSEKDSLLLKKLYEVNSQSTSFFIQTEAIESFPEGMDYYVFYGNWSRNDNYESMQWFLDNVISHINSSIKFIVIGTKMPELIQEQFNSYSNIKYVGFVDNPYKIIANAKALISPLHSGAGVKVKVIESFACGTPVIGTEISFEGIDDKYKDFMIKVESPEDFIQILATFSITKESKCDFKNKFLTTYNRKPILDYIYSL